MREQSGPGPERPHRRTILLAAMGAAIGASPTLRGYARRAAQADEDLRRRGWAIINGVERAIATAARRHPIDNTDVLLSPYDFKALATVPGMKKKSDTVLESRCPWWRRGIVFELFLPDRKPGRGPKPHWRHDWTSHPGRTNIAVWGAGIFGDRCHFEEL